jgi:glucose/mannose transport system substrate-binding protein
LAPIADFKRLRLVPSCAHGSACTRAQTVAAISAVGRFSSAGGVADLQAAIAAGVADLQAAIAAGAAAYRAGIVTR